MLIFVFRPKPKIGRLPLFPSALGLRAWSNRPNSRLDRRLKATPAKRIRDFFGCDRETSGPAAASRLKVEIGQISSKSAGGIAAAHEREGNKGGP